MSATYSGDPSDSRLDAVRSLLGDIGGDDGHTWLLTDEEIEYFDGIVNLSYDDAFMTAAVCAEIISGRFAMEVSISADGVNISGDQLQQKYAALATTLRQIYKGLAVGGGGPLIGGIDAFHVDDPTVRSFNFSVGMNDNIRAGNQTTITDQDQTYEEFVSWFESMPW